jgi:hypothetical protein
MRYNLKIDGVDVTTYLYDGTLTDRLNDDLDEGVLILKSPRQLAYEPNLKTDIEIFDGVTLETKNYVISGDISVKISPEEDDAPLYKHTINLIELTYAIAERAELTTRAFTQQFTGSQFDIYDVVKNMQETKGFDFDDNVDNTRLWQIEGDANLSSERTGLAKRMTGVISPNFVFESLTDKESLDKVIAFIGGIPRLVRNIQGDIILTADFVNDFGKKVNFENETTNWEEQMSISQYTTSLEFELNNVIFDVPDSNIVYEPASETGYNLLKSRTPGEYTTQNAIMPSNQGIVLPTKCLVRVEVIDSIPDTIDVDILPYIFEFSVYDRLKTSSFFVERDTKQGSIYYERNKPDIKGLYLDYGLLQGEAINNVIQFAVEDFYEGAGSVPSYLDIPFYELRFRLEYEAISTQRGRTYKVDSSRMNVSTQRIAGQNDRSLSYGRALTELNGKVQMMGNAVKSVNQRITQLSDAFQIGDFDEAGYIATVKNYELNPDGIIFKYDCSQGYQKLSGFASLNAENRSYDVPESTFKRNVYYEDFIEFSETSKTSTSNLSPSGEVVFYNILRPSPIVQNDRPIRAVLFKTSEAVDFIPSTERLVFPTIPTAGEDCINVYWEIKDPIIAGNQLEFIDNVFPFADKPTLNGISYTNSQGTLNTYSSAYITEYDVTDPELLPVLPLSDVNSGQFLINEDEDDFKVNLDLSEKLAETRSLQVYSETLNKFIIGKYLLEKNNLIKLYNGVYPTLKIVKGLDSYNNNSKDFANEDSVDANVTWSVVNGVIQLDTAITDANAWAIVNAETDELLLGVNQAPFDNPTFPVFGIRTIYINFLENKAGLKNEI